MTSGSVLKLVAAFVLCAVATAGAQTPQTQPLVQAGNLVYLGKFTLPQVDGAGGNLSYGGDSLGLGPDATSLYFGCRDGSGQLARVTIPAVGGVASVVEPCRAVPNLMGIKPTDVNGIKLGGSLSWNGRLVVSAYTFYDGSGSTAFSHFAGAAGVSSLTGPYRVGTDMPAAVGGYMGVIPKEWTGLLGGPALTGKCCTSIIWRSSYGPAASVFNPDHVGTQANIPSTMLVGYTEAHQTLGPWDGVSQYYTGTMRVGGLAFPAGTRSVLFVARRGETFCYGDGAECSDPSNADKGTHGYPYRHVVMAYDANDLLAVKQGTKKHWEVLPYTQWTLPEMKNDGTADMSSAVYDPGTRRWFITAGLTGGAPVVHVYEVTNAVIQPPVPVEICGDGIDNDGDGLVDEGCEEPMPPVEICDDGIDNDKDGLIDEGCDTPIATPGQPRRLFSSVSRSTVNFKWSAPITGGKPADYILEAGLAPGKTFFSTTVGLATSLSVPNVGTGRYYVRVRARNANGTSVPSNEVTVSVGCYTRPRKVSSLTATTEGGLVSLKWTDPDGCSGTSYHVTVSPSTADGARVMATDTPEATTLLVAGSYTARVTTRSEHGVSEPTDLQFTVGSNVCATPRMNLKLRPVVSARRVGLFWSPLDPDVAAADDAVAPVSYVLEAGTAPGVTDIGVVPMGRISQFITDVPPGTYYVRIRAGNACGGGRASNEAKLVVR